MLSFLWTTSIVLVSIVTCQEIEDDAVVYVDAIIKANCVEKGSLFRSDDGGKTLTNEITEAQWSQPDQTYSFALSQVSKSTLVKIRCRNVAGNGGLIAQVTVDGQIYTTEDPMLDSLWSIYKPSLRALQLLPADLQYATQAQAAALSLPLTNSLSADAVWVQIPEHSSIDFYFRFRNVLRRRFPVEEEEEYEWEDFIPFDVDKERAAMRAAGVKVQDKESNAAVVASMDPSLSMQLHNALIIAVISLISMSVTAVVAYQCRHSKLKTEFKPLLPYQSV